MTSANAHRRLLVEDIDLPLDDTILGRIVRVIAGQTSEEPPFPMRRGRIPRGPPVAPLIRQKRSPSVPMDGAWASPCSGVRIRGDQPYPPDGPLWFTQHTGALRGDRWFGTTLTVELGSGSDRVVFDWAGSYRNWWWNETDGQAEIFDEDYRNRGSDFPVLDINISDWQIQATGSVVGHKIEIAWPETAEASLRFRSEDEACDGEPLVVCDVSGCELRQ